jgi:hypothetical protein
MGITTSLTTIRRTSTLLNTFVAAVTVAGLSLGLGVLFAGAAQTTRGHQRGLTMTPRRGKSALGFVEGGAR